MPQVAPPAPVLPEINVVLKADGLGPLEALRKVVTAIANQSSEVSVRMLGSSVGDIHLGDVERASVAQLGKEGDKNKGKGPVAVSYPLLLAFNVNVADAATRATAKELDVKIVRDSVIYRLEDELINLIETCLPKERFLHLEVQKH